MEQWEEAALEELIGVRGGIVDFTSRTEVRACSGSLVRTSDVVIFGRVGGGVGGGVLGGVGVVMALSSSTLVFQSVPVKVAVASALRAAIVEIRKEMYSRGLCVKL